MGDFDCCLPPTGDALAYTDHSRNLADLDTCAGTVAVIAYRGRVTLRVFAYDNWRDAVHPAPELTLAGRYDTDAALAAAWLTEHIANVVAAEPALYRYGVCSTPHRNPTLAEVAAWSRGAAEIAARA